MVWNGKQDNECMNELGAALHNWILCRPSKGFMSSFCAYYISVFVSIGFLRKLDYIVHSLLCLYYHMDHLFGQVSGEDRDCYFIVIMETPFED